MELSEIARLIDNKELQKAQNELIKLERPLREIRAALKAIAKMNEGSFYQWAYSSALASPLAEVWRWCWESPGSKLNGFTLRIIDQQEAKRNTVYQDVTIYFHDSGAVEVKRIEINPFHQ